METNYQLHAYMSQTRLQIVHGARLHGDMAVLRPRAVAPSLQATSWKEGQGGALIRVPEKKRRKGADRSRDKGNEKLPVGPTARG
jgi:hypothetical protein